MSDKLVVQFDSVVVMAQRYADLGWELVRLQPGGKRPIGSWKQPRKWTNMEIAADFSGNANIGIALGERSGGLIDIDFDCPEAADFGRVLLPHLPAFGRKSSPASHRLALCVLGKNRLVYKVPDHVKERSPLVRSVLTEVRSDGHYTMFPPSLHPTGERVTWIGNPASIPTITASELKRFCGIIAFLCVVVAFYPRGAGQRDEICMMLAGVLVRAGLDDETVNTLTELVATLAGDEEASKRTGKAEATRTKIEANEPVWSLPQLCERLKLEDMEKTFRAWLGQKDPSAGPKATGRPAIFIRGGQLPAEVDQAEEALLKANLGVYQRGESLVRVVQLPQSEGEDGVQRPSGALLIHPITSTWLREKFAISADWLKPGDEANIPINPPIGHAMALLARVGEWKAPVLVGVVSCPTMRKDGSILQTPGYDRASGLLYDPGATVFPLVPESPTKEEAAAAIEALAKPFREYRFATTGDRAVVLAACLTAVIRRILPAAPLFAVDAPTAGSGKSLLCETVGIIASGYKPTIISQGKTPEEDEKRLSSVLMAGDAVLVIDNCDRPLGGDTLCSMLTQEIIASRVLGKSEVKRMPTNALVMATGNNLEVVGDLGRRTLVCRIDTGAERPDQLVHGFSPTEEALRDRPALVVAALTVLRAYVVAGHPGRLPPIGSFEDWNLVREALVWLGEDDPTVTRERVMSDDPRRGELGELLELWHDALGGQAVTLSEFAEMTTKTARGKINELQQALAERTLKGTFNTRSVGRYLSRHKDRLVGGRVLRCIDDSSGVKRYRVELANSPPPIDSPF